MDCTVVTQVDERKQLLWRAGQCFSRLRRGHLSRNCRATNRCQQCHRKHHTSICSGSTDRWEPTSGAAAVPPPGTELTTSQPQTHCTWIHSHWTQFACFHAVCECWQTHSAPDCVSCRLQPLWLNEFKASNCDGQWQSAFLPDPTCPRHTSPPYCCKTKAGHCSLWIWTNGSTTMWSSMGFCADKSWWGQEHWSPRSATHLWASHFPTHRQVPWAYPHISCLDLADDPLDETHEIDVLIGSDFYWEFVTGEVVRGEEGPVAINTTLGWMLSGPAGLTGPQGTIVNFVTTHSLQVDYIIFFCITWSTSEHTFFFAIWDIEGSSFVSESILAELHAIEWKAF